MPEPKTSENQPGSEEGKGKERQLTFSPLRSNLNPRLLLASDLEPVETEPLNVIGGDSAGPSEEIHRNVVEALSGRERNIGHVVSACVAERTALPHN